MGPEIVIKQLQSVRVDIQRIPEAHSPDGIVNKILCVAAVLGQSENAQALVSKKIGQQVRLLKVAAERAPINGKFVIILTVRDGSPIVAGLQTSGLGLLLMAGADNIFSDVEGCKPVSLEAIAALNPDFIIVAGRSNAPQAAIETVKKNPAIGITNAAKKNRIRMIDSMALLGFGPRTLDAALELISLASTD